MPRYDYKCRKCETVQEFLLPMSDRPQTLIHDECGGRMVRYFTPPSVNLRQGQAEKIRDKQGNDVVKHWDGRQDVNINAKTVHLPAGVHAPE